MKDFIKRFIIVLIILLVVAAVYFYNKQKKSQTQANQESKGPMPVMVENPVVRDVEFSEEFTGYTVAIQDVDIRARATGILQNINFIKGQRVEKGQLLFEIEPDSYIAAKDRASANLTSAKAKLEKTQQDYDRALIALESNAISESEVRAMKADRDMAKASLLEAEAALRTAEINLSYTKIESPISGIVERHYIDEGNLVGTDMTLLTKVVQTDPMIVSFYISEESLIKLLKSDSLPNGENKPFSLAIAGEDNYRYQGDLDYIESSIDTSTGTLEVRGQLRNENGSLFPGMFVRVRIPADKKRGAILVNERAIGTDLDGKFVYIISPENTVVQQKVEVSAVVDGLRVVERGLRADDQYITTGIQFVRPGMAVQPITPEKAAEMHE